MLLRIVTPSGPQEVHTWSVSATGLKVSDLLTAEYSWPLIANGMCQSGI